MDLPVFYVEASLIRYILTAWFSTIGSAMAMATRRHPGLK